MMTTTDRLAQLINKLNKSWRKDAKKAVAYLQRLLASGMKFEEALDNVQRHYGKLFTLPELKPALVEAAAYAYGIVPTMLTKAQVESMGEELAGKWDESGMTLSEKLHGVGVKMRGAIVSTLQEQMRQNKTWTEAARALYDGYGDDGQNVYNGGKDIISRQDLPKYLQKVREATGNDLQALAEQRQAIDNINRLAKNGAPNKALQAAYNKLLEAVQKGNEKAIEKAVEVAVNEKSRYVAERITRTEMARAWADGFVAKMKTDADIVAVKFKLSSRHPVFDICDMYAKADMYGLGAGIYPKDKLPPLPVHPHCLCRYVEVIEGEVDMQQQRDQVREAGDKWLNSLPESRRAQVLGRKGLKAWEDGEDWRKYMRGYAGLREVKSRLSGIDTRNMANGGRKSKFIKLTETEKDFIIKEAKAIGIDEKYLRFRDYSVTGYDEKKNLIYVSSQIFPSRDDSPIARDRMSVRAVLAHEYYGHMANRNTSLPRNNWIDEFRASYRGAQKCSNLTDEERADLVRDAYDRAKEAGVTVKLTKFARRVLYGF